MTKRTLKAATTDNGHKRELEVVTIDDLNVDHRYQRELNQNLVEKILADWTFMASDVLSVSLRDDGSYWIINGQHRAAAAKLAGETEVLAFVYYGLTVKDEADLRLKSNNRRSDTSLERFHAQIAAENPESLAIAGLCREFGTTVNRTANSHTGINCVSALESVYRVDGGLLLRQTLKFLQESYDEIREEAATEPVVRGTAWFIRTHAREFSWVDARARIRRTDAESLLNKGRAHKQALGGSLWINFYRAMVEVYNHRRSEAHRLEWHTAHKHVIDATHVYRDRGK